MSVDPVFNLTLQDKTIPYITADQYRAAPTAMDTQALIRGGSQDDQDRELDRLVRQASAWCDRTARQPLSAQTTTETMRSRVTKEGTVRLHPRQWPIVSVNGVAFGVDAGSLSTLNSLTSVWVENQSVIVPLQAALGSTGFSGPLQFNRAVPDTRLLVALTYVAGYAVTTLAAGCQAADSTITVTDPTGIAPGMQLRLSQGGGPDGDGTSQTALWQGSVVVASVAASTVTLTGQVGITLDAGAACTALPEEVEQACIYATTGMIKQGGYSALLMGGGSATVAKAGGSPGDEEFALAESILEIYQPVAP